MAVTSVAAISVEVILAGGAVVAMAGMEAVTAGEGGTGGEAVTAGIVVTAGVAVGTVAAGMEVVRTGTDTPIGGIILTVTKTNSRWGLAATCPT